MQRNDEKEREIHIRSRIEDNEGDQWPRLHANNAHAPRGEIGNSVDDIEDNDQAIGN